MRSWMWACIYYELSFRVIVEYVWTYEAEIDELAQDILGGKNECSSSEFHEFD